MISLRPYQRAAVDSVYSYFSENAGNPLVVIPTAGGKSLIMATFIREVVEAIPGERLLVVTHVKELIEQNHAELVGLWPQAPAGIYSAGLGRRDINAQILFAGIQSIHKRAYSLQKVDIILIDEAHLLSKSDGSMYRRFLSDLLVINPYLKVVGLTATPYRLDSGMLHHGEDRLFTDIAYEVSVRKLIDDGFLCPVVSKQTTTQLDVSGVGTRGGEFIPGQLEAAVDLEEVTRAAVGEIVEYGQDRHSWLVFASGVSHAKHIRDEIRSRGYSCESIFGDTPKEERANIIERFKSGKIRCLSSMAVLTTGFNAKSVDLIAMLRPTKSTGLYVQIIGRGTRLFDGKRNCLILDFAGNVRRHGPIDLVKPRDKTKGEGEAPVKTCPKCESILPISATECPDCGYIFPAPKVKIEKQATALPVLSTQFVPPQWVSVDDVSYRRHEKPGKPPSLKVTYQCGLTSFQEWVCLEHDGFARSKAVQWWAKRAPGVAVPDTIEDALANAHALAHPTKISIRPSGQFTEIVGVSFQ